MFSDFCKCEIVDGENETDISKRSEEQKEEFDIDVIAC
jgi:hypothetical protein